MFFKSTALITMNSGTEKNAEPSPHDDVFLRAFSLPHQHRSLWLFPFWTRELIPYGAYRAHYSVETC
ncbi:hypothetical protein ACMWQB_29570, partial [Escherichia coli]